MAATQIGGNYETVGTRLADGTKTAVFTCPASTWRQVNAIQIAAGDGVASSATIAWYDASTGFEFCVEYQCPIPTQGSFTLEYMPLALEPGDEIRVTGAANQDVIVSMLRQSRGGT